MWRKFSKYVLDTVAGTFASILDAHGPEPHACDYLRKDYSFLFERFFYYLEDKDELSSGIVVFDELEKPPVSG